MFGLFKRQSKSTQVSYKFFVSEVEKYRFLATKMLEASDGKFVLLYHFENTKAETEQLLNAAKVTFSTDRNSGERILLLSSTEFLTTDVSGIPTIFVIEIYPLPDRDSNIAKKAAEKEYPITFYASLDSPFFQLFGGDRITNLLQQMGVEPGEVIEHKFINSAVIKVQDKIKKGIENEQPVIQSLEAWMSANKIENTI